MTANENYLLDRDENAAIDANSMISMFVADRSHSDRMCDLGMMTYLLGDNTSITNLPNRKYMYYHPHSQMLLVTCSAFK